MPVNLQCPRGHASNDHCDIWTSGHERGGRAKIRSKHGVRDGCGKRKLWQSEETATSKTSAGRLGASREFFYVVETTTEEFFLEVVEFSPNVRMQEGAVELIVKMLVPQS